MVKMNRKICRIKYINLLTGLLVTSIALTGCDLTRNYTKIDRAANANVQDLRDFLEPRPLELPEPVDQDIPAFQPAVASLDGTEEPVPLVSIAINQSVPLRDALFELAREIDYDLQLDSRIRGSIIFTARDRPLNTVLDRISSMAGLRYELDNKTIRVELDTPYQKTYRLSYLNMIRTNNSSISSSLDISSAGGDDSTESTQTQTGSNFTVNSSFSSDFWQEFEVGLQHLLSASLDDNNLSTAADPRLRVANSQQAPPGAETTAGDGAQEEAQQQARGQDTRLEEPELEVQSLPVDDFDDDRDDRRRGGRGADGENIYTYSINRQNGIINVYAPKSIHDRVQEYLYEVRRVMTSQVLLEAKVLEVSLSDEFSSGIDWSIVFREGIVNTGFGVTSELNRPALNPAGIGDFSFVWDGSDISSVVNALSRFGTTRALASPRITVLNNQPAVLNVTENIVFFDLEVTTEEDEDTGEDEVRVDSEARSVPEGVIINVHPVIDLDSQSVTLSLRPTVSNVTQFVEDPGPRLSAASLAGITPEELASISSSVPQLSVQQFDSVVRMGSKEVLVLGGLLEDRVESEQQGVPVLSEVPMFGSLFRTQSDRVEKTELVVLLKATILNNAGSSIHPFDRDLYNQMAGDRRPFRF